MEGSNIHYLNAVSDWPGLRLLKSKGKNRNIAQLPRVGDEMRDDQSSSTQPTLLTEDSFTSWDDEH